MDPYSTIRALTPPTTKATKRKAADQDNQDGTNRGPDGTTPAPKRAKKIAGAHDSSQTDEQKPTQKAQSHKQKAVFSHRNVLSNTADTPQLDRPWLKRPQKLSEQQLFLIFCRDNLVPGSKTMKPWDQVAVEFNERFKDELKQPLAWNTLSKRAGPARKQFMADNPEYALALNYPVPEYAKDDEDGEVHEDVGTTMAEQKKGENESPTSGHDLASEDSARLPQQATQVESEDKVTGDAYSVTNANGKIVSQHPGPYYPTLISDHNISALDRARYHLRRRTKNTVTFRFLDDDEAELDDEDPQYIDHDIVLSVSPFYERISQSNLDAALNIPKKFSIKTVNIFIQIISPDRANALPTHYLWRDKHQVPGVYDRFGAIKPEKIYWSVDVLFELEAFGRYMEVAWISDMVIDRLHWMFTEQKKVKDACMQLALQHERRDAHGKKVYVVPRLSATKDAHFWSLAADDFDEQYLAQLVADPKAEKALTFVADLMHLLGGAPDAQWLATAPKHAQYMFANAKEGKVFTSASRDEFCARYHHHDDMSSCYSAAPTPSSKDIINSLYTFSSRNELLMSSSQLMPTTTLAYLVHSASGGSTRTFKAANSSSGMLEAEKMIWEMEIRLEEAKMALCKSQKVGADD
jgi:hypothetical protein